MNSAVEPSFTLSGLRSTAKIHDAENNRSVGFKVFLLAASRINSTTTQRAVHKSNLQSTAPPESLHRGSPLAIDVSPSSSPSKSAGGRSYAETRLYRLADLAKTRHAVPRDASKKAKGVTSGGSALIETALILKQLNFCKVPPGRLQSPKYVKIIWYSS